VNKVAQSGIEPEAGFRPRVEEIRNRRR